MKQQCNCYKQINNKKIKNKKLNKKSTINTKIKNRIKNESNQQYHTSIINKSEQLKKN